MKIDEDLARLHLNEAIQYGMQSQEIARGLEKRGQSNWKIVLMMVCLVLILVLILATMF
jgi:hypothetical protein